MGRSSSRGRSRLSVLAVATVAALTASVIVVSGAQAAKNPVVGAVYTETNDTSDNEVIAFDRKKKGNLKLRDRVSTGGVGSTQSVGCGPGCPILDSQYAVQWSPEGFVFAVNAGSDTVTSFADNKLIKGKGGLKRKSEVASGGDMPESIAVSPSDNVVYVLNVNTANSDGTTGNISGFTYNEKGKLKPIDGSSQPLASPSPPEGTPGGAATARGISFDPKGKKLVVTELAGAMGAGTIITFKVSGSGQSSPGVVNPSARPFPFGQRFAEDGTLIVPTIEHPMGAATGMVSTYNVAGNGTVSLIGSESSNDALPCWVAVTPENDYVYVVNTGAGAPAGPTPSIARYSLSGDGTLGFLGLTSSPDDFAETDVDISVDGKYLYVLAPSVGNPSAPASHIDQYKIKGNGNLKSIGSTKARNDLGIGVTGLAAI